MNAHMNDKIALLDFDAERFRHIQAGALSLAEPLNEAIQGLLQRGAANLFFLGTGGAGVLMAPAAELMSYRSTFPVRVARAAEIVAAGDASLGPQSIVVIPSLSGTTPESIEVLRYCKGFGATVIALTGADDTPVADEADLSFTNFAEDDTSSESFYLQSLFIVMSIMEHHDGLGLWDRTVAQLADLPELLIAVKRAFEAPAAELAESFKDEPYHIITGSGITWPEAWYYGTCILEEMQWIRTRPIHAADFFHGTLELVESDVSVVIFKGEDATRSLCDRVEAFASTISEKVTIVDTADWALPGIDPDVRAMLSHITLATALERLSAHLQVVRDHPLTTRRYYRRVAY
jgi:fructoselysine-6-phosphate deglycase